MGVNLVTEWEFSIRNARLIALIQLVPPPGSLLAIRSLFQVKAKDFRTESLVSHSWGQIPCVTEDLEDQNPNSRR
jgi:hypothetical protein